MTAIEAWLSAAATSLRVSPLRTLLSTLGVVIGVAALVAILTLSNGLENYARQQISGTTDIQTVRVTPRAFEVTNGLTVRRENVPALNAADAQELERRLGGLGDVTVGMSAGARLALVGGTTRSPAMLIATLPSATVFIDDVVSDGRFIQESDLAEDGRVAVVSENLAQRLGAAIDDRVMIDSLEFEVVGLAAPRDEETGSGVPGDDTRPGRVYIPFSATQARRLNASGRQPAGLAARSRNVEHTERMQDLMEAWLIERWGSLDRFDIASYRARAAQARTGFLVLRLVMGSIAGISLIVGGIGIMNILLASVSERTREIGVRKALGARPRDILLQFLSESVAITGLGSVIGVLLGVGAAFGVAAAVRSLSDAPVYAGFGWASVVIAAGAAILVGLVFGTYPARRAARLSPIEAIRHE